MNPDVSYFAKTDFRNTDQLFGVKQKDRLSGGMYILGKTGTGKTNLLKGMIAQDAEWNRGFCVIDIHGDMIREVYARIPEYRKKDCVYIDVNHTDYGYNPLRKVRHDKRHLIASHLIETFQKVWSKSWGVKLEYIIRNTILALLDQDTMSFSDIPRLLTNSSFREQCVKNVVSSDVRDFFIHQFPNYSKTDILPVLNKIGSFLTIPSIKKILVENKRSLSISQIMDQGKILLINLSKGMIGADASVLLGSLFLGGISAAAFHRSHIEEWNRKPFHVFLDEFHHFVTLTLVNSFSEHRKYGISYTVAHQYISQLPVAIRDAVLGNISTIICFRIAFQDAKYMAQEFFPVFTAHDLINLENYHIYLKLMIDGKPSKPFSARTLKE